MRQRDEVFHVLREEKTDCRDGSAAGDHKVCPAIEEAHAFAIDFAEILVESARLRHLPYEFALRQRAEEREDAGQNPDAKQVRRAR